MKFEKTIRLSANKIIKECVKEIDNSVKTKWTIEKKRLLNYGSHLQEKRISKAIDEDITEIETGRHRDIQKQNQQARIERSRHNSKYKIFQTTGSRRYLKKPKKT